MYSFHRLRWRWSLAHLAARSLGFPSMRGLTCQFPAKIPVCPGGCSNTAIRLFFCFFLSRHTASAPITSGTHTARILVARCHCARILGTMTPARILAARCHCGPRHMLDEARCASANTRAGRQDAACSMVWRTLPGKHKAYTFVYLERSHNAAVGAFPSDGALVEQNHFTLEICAKLSNL